MKSRSGVVYSYNGPGLPTWEAVSAGQAPKERLFGAFQLSRRGFDIEVSDHQWAGGLAGFRRRVNSLLELPSFGLMRRMLVRSTLVLQGRVAPILQLVAAALGCRVVYVDVMFDVPTRPILRWLYAVCINHAYQTVSYSSAQNKKWVDELGLNPAKLMAARYPMDADFYRSTVASQSPRTRLLAVGRDPGRDFTTLVEAIGQLRTPLTLVTLEYLIPQSALGAEHVRIRQRLDYEELFVEYDHSLAAIVPLKRGIDYPSGIRAVLEAMLVGVPVIATRTPVLEEHFTHENHLLFVPPEDAEAIREAIRVLKADPELSRRIAENARQAVISRFNVEQFADSMAHALSL